MLSRKCLILGILVLAVAGCSRKTRDTAIPSDLPPTDAVGVRIAMISVGNADDRLDALKTLPALIENHSRREELRYAIPKLESLLTHENDSIRYWAAMSLGKLGPMANEATPQLIESLADKVGDYSSKSSASGILYALGEISPKWADRNDVPQTVRERYPKQ